MGLIDGKQRHSEALQKAAEALVDETLWRHIEEPQLASADGISDCGGLLGAASRVQLLGADAPGA
jgi:hypothetical protein